MKIELKPWTLEDKKDSGKIMSQCRPAVPF